MARDSLNIVKLRQRRRKIYHKRTSNSGIGIDGFFDSGFRGRKLSIKTNGRSAYFLVERKWA